VSQDAVALLRLEDLYLDSFEISDGATLVTLYSLTAVAVKNLQGDNLSRAIGTQDPLGQWL
jgi:hypothetical protein